MLFAVTMPILPSGRRRPLSPGSRAGLGAAVVLLVAISAVEMVDGSRAEFVGLLAAVPFLAAVFAFWQPVLAVQHLDRRDRREQHDGRAETGAGPWAERAAARRETRHGYREQHA